MHQAPYGFRIVGSCSETRRLVDATAALSGYAECVEQAELTNEGYLSAFQFGDEFRRHLEMTGSTKGYKGPCWSPWLWWDIDRKDDIEAAARAARRLASFLVDRYRIDGDELLIFYSGSKGFHVGLPSASRPTREFTTRCERSAHPIAGTLKRAVTNGDSHSMSYCTSRCLRFLTSPQRRSRSIFPNHRHPTMKRWPTGSRRQNVSSGRRPPTENAGRSRMAWRLSTG